MIATEKITLHCPVCEKDFESQKMASENLSPLKKRTDFHPYVTVLQSGLPFKIHTCYRCGYTKTIEGFVEEPQTHADYGLVTFLKQDIFPRLDWLFAGITASEKYEAYARIREYEGATSKVVADHFLMAAWCCVEEKDPEAERYFRILAVQKYHDSLASFDELSSDEFPIVTYLIGELWRRIGDKNQSIVWFNKVLALEPGLSKDKQWLIPLCRQQIKDPHEWFGTS